MFVQDAGYVPGTGHVPADDAFTEYREWMTNNGYRPLSKGNFVRRFLSLIPSADYKQVRTETGIVRSFVNVNKNRVI
ncbi:MAG: hypothetical protein A2498_00870 [Lentisphaerae bacterium RIFOXYC12_FULL_60_16]|nr:MAG: hypothetical protein A2498_00870 [Lentisphaerae bacterium RIFOXYC12_FULL_60_16]